MREKKHKLFLDMLLIDAAVYETFRQLFFDFVKFRGIDSAVALSKEADTEEVLEWLSR